MFEKSGQRKVVIHAHYNSHAINSYALYTRGIFAHHATHAIQSHAI